MFYKVFCEDDYEIINLVNRDDYDYLFELDGSSKKDVWKDFEVTFEAADKGRKKRHSDFPWYNGAALILRENVAAKMKDFFERHGELLPIHSSDAQRLFVFKCKTIDALDEEKSEIMRLKSGKIILVKKFEFKDIDNIHADIFRLNYRGSPTFVSEKFINLYKEFNFVGLKFSKYSETMFVKVENKMITIPLSEDIGGNK